MKSNIINNLNIKIFADGASYKQIINQNEINWISGFTTNPTLMKKNGINNYKGFAIDVLSKVHNKPISFEVFSDDLSEMYDQALEISSWGENVNVKIPISNTKGEFTYEIIEKLNNQKIKTNITAIFSYSNVEKIAQCLNDSTYTIISIFAGRIADTGVDPANVISKSVELFKARKNIDILWASPREVLNIFQADELGCDIITIADDIFKKIPNIGKDLDKFSLETVKMFYDDAVSSDFKIEIKK